MAMILMKHLKHPSVQSLGGFLQPRTGPIEEGIIYDPHMPLADGTELIPSRTLEE